MCLATFYVNHFFSVKPKVLKLKEREGKFKIGEDIRKN